MSEKVKKMPRELSLDSANRILLTALQANQLEENPTPLETLVSYSNYRREKFYLQRMVAMLLLLLFLFIPVLFVSPQYTVTADPLAEPGRPAFIVELEGQMPVARVTAMVDGVSMPVYEDGARSFSVRPTLNGKMEITVVLFNDQRSVETVRVTGVDYDPPEMLANQARDKKIWFTLADEGTGLDFEAVYAVTPDGTELRPVEFNEEAGEVAFDYPEETLNIFFFDLVGNRLQIVLVPNGQ